MYTNADQLPNKMDALKTRIKIQNPHIVVITEVNIKNCKVPPDPVIFNIPGYNMHTKNLSGKESGRGIIIYSHETIKEIIEVTANVEFKEYLLLSAKMNKSEKLLVGGIYRSEAGSTDNNKALLALIKEIGNMNFQHKLLMGDFNYKYIDWDNMSTSKNERSEEFKFVEAIKDSFFFQHVKKSTRARGTQNSNILDLVLTDEADRIDDIEFTSPIGKSDHAVLVFDYRVKRDINYKPKFVFKFHKGDYDQMKNILNINWENELSQYNNDINTQWNIIKEKILNAQDECIPKIDLSSKPKWQTEGRKPLKKEILDEIRRKHRLWQRYIETGTQEKFDIYKQQRNKVNKLLRRERMQIEKSIASDAKANPKKFWKYIKSQTNVKPAISPLVDKNKKKTENELEQAQVLSDFFAEVLEKEPDGDLPYMPDRELITPPLTTIAISKEKVLKKLNKLNPSKSSGPDNLHPRVLKEIGPAIADPLTLLFNNSLTLRQIPDQWKTAVITPIYKKGKKSDPGNYRPVSLTCNICKIDESFIFDAIYEHMEQNNFFSNRQYGFIKFRNTVLQLIKVVNDWVDVLDDGGSIDNINMDFQKAFDKVPHRRLIYKLQKYGIGGQVLSWVETFLHQRKQCVNVNGYLSDYKEVLSGIPQGSVLGALLFVIYINDMPQNIESEIYLFADDTKFYRQVKDYNDAVAIQNDLNSLKAWSEKWLLKFHPDKCVILRISLDEEIEEFYYKLGQDHLKYVTNVKDLGIIMDGQLKFTDHIYEKIKKANNVMGTIRRSFKYLDCKTFRLLYCAQVRTILEYGSQVFSPYLKKDITAIENVQRRATKRVLGLRHMSYEQRLRALDLPTLAFRRFRGSLIEVYKIFNIYDQAVVPTFTLSENTTRGHSMKISYNGRCKKTHPKMHSFCQRIIKPWNELPQHVVESKNLNGFKNTLDKHYKDHPMKFSFGTVLI